MPAKYPPSPVHHAIIFPKTEQSDDRCRKDTCKEGRPCDTGYPGMKNENSNHIANGIDHIGHHRYSSAGGGIELSKYKVSPKTPVRYRGKSRSPRVYKAGVKKDGGIKPLDGDPKSFVAVMKSGHVGVFTRKNGKSLPIKQLYGPSVPQIVKNEDIMSKINKEASETLQKRIDAEINNILRKG